MNIIRRYLNIPSSQLKKYEINDALNSIKYKYENGLNEEELLLLAKALVKLNLSPTGQKLLIDSLIPAKQVPENVIEVILRWLLMNYKDIKATALKELLNWLIGLVCYRLVDTKHIQPYFELFVWIIERDKNPQAVQLLILLLRPEHVTNFFISRIEHLKKIQEINEFNVLLYKCKEYNPLIIPKVIPVVQKSSLFRFYPKRLTEAFSEARKRNRAGRPPAREDDESDSEQFDIGRTETPRVNILVPRRVKLIEHLSPESSDVSIFYRKIETEESLNVTIKKGLKLINSVRLMSLLNTQMGRLCLICSKEDVQKQLNSLIYHSLYSALLDHDRYTPYEETKKLLELLQLFQLEMNESIPAVTSILSKYLRFWDGDEHQDLIYELIEYVWFDNYRDLYNSVLRYLVIHFTTGTMDVKCKIFTALGNLIANIIFRHKTITTIPRRKKIFAGRKITMKPSEFLNNLYRFVDALTKRALLVERENMCLIQHSIIQLNERILISESRFPDLRSWNIAPEISYNALFSYDLPLLTTVCDLFYKYPKGVIPEVMNDFLNILHNKQFKPDETSFLHVIEHEHNSMLEMYGLKILQISKGLNINNHAAVVGIDYELLTPQGQQNLKSRLIRKAHRVQLILNFLLEKVPSKSDTENSKRKRGRH